MKKIKPNFLQKSELQQQVNSKLIAHFDITTMWKSQNHMVKNSYPGIKMSVLTFELLEN